MDCFACAFISFLAFTFYFENVNAYRKNKKMYCRIGQSISDIYWTDDNGYKTFFIACENITESCTETCEWSIACTIDRHGYGSYLRGVHALYDNFEESQRLLFLCCNSSKIPYRHCSGKFEEDPSAAPGWPIGSIRQAKTTALASHGSMIYLEKCARVQQFVELCPLRRTKLHMRVDPDVAGTAALASLAGLSGLALIRKPAQMKPPCCCPSSAMVCVIGCATCGIYDCVSELCI